MSEPKTIRLIDYKRPSFTTDVLNLDFQHYEDHIDVKSKAIYHRTAEGDGAHEIVFDVKNPNTPSEPDYLQSVTVNGVSLNEYGYIYDKENGELRIQLDPSETDAEIEFATRLYPKTNTTGIGVFWSEKCSATQCEATEFRKIVPALDRPDVMCRFNVRIEAPKATHPVLLTNGDQTGASELDNGRHWASFETAFAIPDYLFAEVAGDLKHIGEYFTAKDGHGVLLRSFVEEGDAERGRYGLKALIKAMEFDENVFDAVYRQNKFDTAALSKLSFSAMENMALNIFRDTQILVDKSVSTDANFLRAKRVRAHEYFHTKSGNETTLANFLHVSLKEGLTVKREHMFMAQETSPAFERIHNAKFLRASQFPEDDGPLAHQVLPDEVDSIDNCYSPTIYEKGAELLEMVEVMIGRDKFIQGVKNFFENNRGKAVFIQDLLHELEKVSGLELASGQFFQWYKQAGRPRVKAEGVYDAAAKTYTLTLSQKMPGTVKPMMIPVKLGLVDKQGNAIPLTLLTDHGATVGAGKEERVLNFTKAKQTFVFTNVENEPAFHSLMRNFSAPVDLDPGLSKSQFEQMMVHDKDDFNRWDAGQRLAMAELLRLYDGYTTTGSMPEVSKDHIETVRQLLNDRKSDPAILTLALTPPAKPELESAVLASDHHVSPQAVSAVYAHLHKTVAHALEKEFSDLVIDLQENKRAYDPDDYKGMGERSLKGLAMQYLTDTGAKQYLEFAKFLYTSSDNMTDKESAVLALRDQPSSQRDFVMGDLLEKLRDDKMAVQNWFTWYAGSDTSDVINGLKKVSSERFFDWNTQGHVRLLFGAFAGSKDFLEGNYNQFHTPEGYKFLADSILKEDRITPHIAAGFMVDSLCSWRNYDDKTQKLMLEQLERVAAAPNLSNDTGDKVRRSLPTAVERRNLFNPPDLKL
ncbi:MAG TPA: DUF3458 domain-containing protein [Patescibacteria group bacterium]|nr:DUF3458 domain-containing protein [Patescibacteria group bacterium]